MIKGGRENVRSDRRRERDAGVGNTLRDGKTFHLDSRVELIQDYTVSFRVCCIFLQIDYIVYLLKVNLLSF